MSSDDDTAVTDVTRPVANVDACDCLVIVHPLDAQAGKSIALDQTPVRIGRDTDNEVVLTDDGVSRRHARLERREQALVLMDVGSKNGTLLNDRELSGIAELNSGDRIKIGSMIFKYLSAFDLEAALHEQIFANTITDELTELFNRRHFRDEFARECSRARRHQRSLSLMMIDIDHFKRVNDQHGHHVGDIVLKAVADSMRVNLRRGDLVARVGGEEFAALLPETGLEGALLVAEKLRAAVAELWVYFRDLRLSVSVSVGVSEFAEQDQDADAFYERCDDLLFAAKSAGRNRIAH